MRKILVNVNIQFEYDDDMFKHINGEIDDEDIMMKVLYDMQEIVEDGDTSRMDIDITEEEYEE